MPKVSKKEARAEAGAALAAAPPLPMDTGADEPPHAEPGAGGEPSRAGGVAAGEPAGGRGEAAGDAGARGGQPSTSGAAHRPTFAPLSAFDQSGRRVEFRRVTVPAHRMTPLKNAWLALYKPATENLRLDMRMNLKTRKVEIKTTKDTADVGHLQKAADFVHAYILGFEVADAVALLRLDDLYIECFEIKDVKTLRGEHLSRCIGRLAGKSGKTKFTIENATKTRVVLADTRIHILGSFQNIRICRDAICALIMGSPPGKVYSKLRSVCSHLNSSY